jgi:linoleoyl-CoA desaturase
MSTPKFLHASTDFYQELKKRVNQYFTDRKKSSTGNFGLLFKAVFFFSAYIGLYIHLVYFMPAVWLAILECVLFGGFTAAIGFNVMHDGGHGSFSKSKSLNKMAAISVNFLGASSIMWNMKHNIIHHTYTNIDGVDDDIEIKPYLRMCPTQNVIDASVSALYVWFLYTLLHLIWVFLPITKSISRRESGQFPLKN